jgi:hypothetical protein
MAPKIFLPPAALEAEAERLDKLRAEAANAAKV